MELGLRNKVVVITGGAGGIGCAAAAAFAREGAHVGVVDIDEEGLERARALVADIGGSVTTAVADLATQTGVEEGIQAVCQANDGALDVLINNVGVCFARSFDELTDEDWIRTLELNLMSCIRATRVALPIMRARGAGCIVNNASDLARQPEVAPPDYQVSKVGIISVTKALALAEAPAVRVNAVAPGPIWTGLWTKPGGFAETLSNLHGMPAEQAVEHELSLRQLPLGRIGTPEEVANVFVFLASDAASFVTGSVWGVDGGSIRGLL
jgi:NAD(P)-dependent dehydrogenase (short-subunit alcohol dehydrogenase family)